MSIGGISKSIMRSNLLCNTKKPPRDEKPSGLREVKYGYGGNGSEYFSLVLLIACFILIINLILEII